MTDAAAVVRAQVDAFNAHNLDAFLATYAPDASVAGIAPEVLTGHTALRDFYFPRLKDPALQCAIEMMLSVSKRWVVVREFVTSTRGTSETLAAFDVVDSVITRASILKA